MDKKNVISLVLGLIIGGLAIWMIMAFTGAGSTMVLKPKNVSNAPLTSPPTETSFSTATPSLMVNCEEKTANFNPSWTKNDTRYSMSTKMTGTKCGDIFTVKAIEIVDMNDALQNREQAKSAEFRTKLENGQDISLGLFDDFSPNANDTTNVSDELARIKTGLGVSTISLPSEGAISRGIIGISSSDSCPITDAGWREWWKKTDTFCHKHPWVCVGIAVLILL